MTKNSIAAKIQDYLTFYAALKEVTDEIRDDVTTTRLTKNKWSIKEIIGHLVDTELNYNIRMKKIIAEDNPFLPKFDQDKWADNLKYDEIEIKESLLLFGLLRTSMAGILRRLPPSSWKRAGKHEERGKVTLEELLDSSNAHCKSHLAQIIAVKMRLEKE